MSSSGIATCISTISAPNFCLLQSLPSIFWAFVSLIVLTWVSFTWFFVQYSICVWAFTYKSDVNTAPLADGFMFNFPVVKSRFSTSNFSQRPKMILEWKEKWDHWEVLCWIIEFSQHDSVSHWIMSPQPRQFMALLIFPQTKEELCQQKYLSEACKWQTAVL